MCCAVYAVCPNPNAYVETINGVCCFTNAIVAVYQLSRTTFSTSLFMIFTQSCTHALPRSFIFHFVRMHRISRCCYCCLLSHVFVISLVLFTLFFYASQIENRACLPACLLVCGIVA